jgi:hypothetical protein
LEKLFVDPLKIEELNVKLGRESLSIQVTRAKNSVAEPLPDVTMLTEVMSVAPFESPELSLEKDSKSFIKKKGCSGETLELPKEEAPTRPPVELKPLPAGLRYAFLNGNK